MSLKNKQLIIFDLDGTLVDSFKDIQVSLNHAMIQFGYPQHDLESVKSFVGHGMDTLVRRAVKAHLTDDVVREISTVIKEYYADHSADHARPYDGMIELLQDLKNQGLSLKVLSNKPHHLLELVLQKCNLISFFESYLGQKEGHPIKPDPILLKQIEDSLDPSNIVMVGDGEADAEFARNAKIDFIGVSWGNGEYDTLSQFGLVAANVNQLRTILSEVTFSSH